MIGCRSRWKTITVVAALSALAIMAARAQSPQTATPGNGALFLAIAPVLQHPRCMNCHTQVDAPRQGDDQHRHIINVRRGADGHGAAAMRCTTCHGRANNAASGAGLYAYSVTDAAALVARARRLGCAGILTTGKDAVKLDPAWFGDLPCWVVGVELEFLNGRSTIEALLKRCLEQRR